MASGLHSWSQTAANNSTADSTINWAEGQAPSSVNDSARALMAIVAKWRDDNAGTITTGGSSTAYTAAPSTTFASFTELNGQTLVLKMHATSGATPTLNVNSLGAKNIKSVSGTNIPTGYLLEGGIYAFTYSSANNEFVCHGIPGALGTLATLTVSGATSVGALTGTSTFDLTGNFAINTNKFNVTAASGNTTVAGTLGVTGAATLSSTLAVTGALTGSSTISGTNITASGALSGATVAGAMVADQTAMEAASATNLLVAPGNMKYHPGVLKAAARVNQAGTQAYTAQFGFSGTPTDGGTGVSTLTLATAMSDASYYVLASSGATGASTIVSAAPASTTTITVQSRGSTTGSATDNADVHVFVFGDQ